jgi:uncharacterized protein (DUF2141 family)
MMRGIALLLLNAVLAGTAQAASIALTIETPKPGRGTYFIAVHGSAATFPQGQPAHAEKSAVTDEQQGIRIEIPAGRYAIAVYQDLNANGELDSNLVGAPTEPVGFSRNATGAMGPPDFAKAAFEIDHGQRRLTIQLTD